MATEKDIAARDAKRNIGEELLQAIKDVKAGKCGARYQVEANDITRQGSDLNSRPLPCSSIDIAQLGG